MLLEVPISEVVPDQNIRKVVFQFFPEDLLRDLPRDISGVYDQDSRPYLWCILRLIEYESLDCFALRTAHIQSVHPFLFDL